MIGGADATWYGRCPDCLWTRHLVTSGRLAPHTFVDVNGHDTKAPCPGAGRHPVRKAAVR